MIINAGTNNQQNDDVINISNDIFELVEICGNNGVKEVFVSAITFRSHYSTEVRNLNNFIESKQHIYNFMFIGNNNILAKDIGRDNLQEL